jgi:dihydrofolate synthase/folylpolyglutamate synthase
MHQNFLSYFDELERLGIILGLERIQRFLELLGNPQDRFRSIHIAGTNGKGSTAAMVESILRCAGYKTALYTSPHLVCFNERVQVNGKKISNPELQQLVSQLRSIKEKADLKLTFFEFTTALAFEYFKRKKIDFAVIETGMGGRLDATNVLKPLVSVITNVSIEHRQYLGNTLQEIAFEKAGIIKQGVPLITSEKNPVVLRVLRKECKRKKSKLIKASKSCNGKIALQGSFQRTNAAMAIAVIRELRRQGVRISEKAIRNGLTKVHFPGRFTEMQRNPIVLLDCCHNSGAALALAKAFRRGFKGKKALLVIGVSSDKDIRQIALALAPLSSLVIVTGAKIRAMQPEKVKKEFERNGKKAIIVKGVKNAVRKAIAVAGKNRLVLVAGSCFVVGEAIQLWKKP